MTEEHNVLDFKPSPVLNVVGLLQGNYPESDLRRWNYPEESIQQEHNNPQVSDWAGT